MEAYNQLAKILRTKPEVLLNLDKRMSEISGKGGVVKNIYEEIESKIASRLSELGLSRESGSEEIYDALVRDLIKLENKLKEYLGGIDLNIVAKKSLEIENPGKGLFLKKEKAAEILTNNPPPNILSHFGDKSAEELIEREGLSSVYSALRFIESKDWMNQTFINAYKNLTINDFEEREVEVFVLDKKWLQAAEKFLEKKYHNVSHLKELGIIFVVPIDINTDGELLRVFTLLLHYLNEVPFYSSLFKKYGGDSDFSDKLQSLLRGDVIDELKIKNEKLKFDWLIIQRYLAKDDENDSRLFAPHINPEAEHWYKAQVSLGKVPGFESLVHYDYVGGAFKFGNPSSSIQDDQSDNRLISFDLIDLIMSLVKKGEVKYLYHQQEALWNKIFIEYFGRDKMNELVEENIIKGFIQL